MDQEFERLCRSKEASFDMGFLNDVSQKNYTVFTFVPCSTSKVQYKTEDGALTLKCNSTVHTDDNCDCVTICRSLRGNPRLHQPRSIHRIFLCRVPFSSMIKTDEENAHSVKITNANGKMETVTCFPDPYFDWEQVPNRQKFYLKFPDPQI